LVFARDERRKVAPFSFEAGWAAVDRPDILVVAGNLFEPFVDKDGALPRSFWALCLSADGDAVLNTLSVFAAEANADEIFNRQA
jgi:hypothetical protein